MLVTEFASIWEWIVGLLCFILMILIIISLIILYVGLIPINFFFWLVGDKDWNNTKPVYYINRFCEDLF